MEAKKRKGGKSLHFDTSEGKQLTTAGRLRGCGRGTMRKLQEKPALKMKLYFKV